MSDTTIALSTRTRSHSMRRRILGAAGATVLATGVFAAGMSAMGTASATTTDTISVSTASTTTAAVPMRNPLPPDFGSATLHEGSTGKYVENLQNLLVDADYLDNINDAGVDGHFGPKTKAAVIRYQEDQGLGVDGRVGPATKAALTDTYDQIPWTGGVTNYGPHTLALGSNGAYVDNLQISLIHNGAKIDEDADFGPKTEAAVKTFQADHGLQVDGRVGPATKLALAATHPTR